MKAPATRKQLIKFCTTKVFTYDIRFEMKAKKYNFIVLSFIAVLQIFFERENNGRLAYQSLCY